MKKISYLICLFCLLLLFQCEQEQTPPTYTPNQSNGANLLATVKKPDDVTVNFYEIGPGNVVINTTYLADNRTTAPAQINNLISSGKSAIEIYKSLAGQGANVNEITAIEEARARHSAQPRLSADELKATQEFFAKKNNHSSTSNARTQQSCSPDYYGDNYGDQWFLTYFGQALRPGFLLEENTNVRYWSETIYYRSVYNLNVMAGDNWVPVDVWFQWIKAFRDVRNVKFTVQPNEVSQWFIGIDGNPDGNTHPNDGSSNVKLKSVDTCVRIHYSRLKDNPF